MTTIYEQFDAATRSFTAYAILSDGEAVGRVVIKFGTAVTAYVQVWGMPMTKGRAGGGGYDRATAAVSAALQKIDLRDAAYPDPKATATVTKILEAFAGKGGERWTSILEGAGFVLANVTG
jgi:hypothetical protein